MRPAGPGDALALVESADKPCGKALVEEELTPGRVGRVAVYGHSAFVDADTGALFLSRFPTGWLVVAAGCEPRPDQSYDCVLEGG